MTARDRGLAAAIACGGLASYTSFNFFGYKQGSEITRSHAVSRPSTTLGTRASVADLSGCVEQVLTSKCHRLIRNAEPRLQLLR